MVVGDELVPRVTVIARITTGIPREARCRLGGAVIALSARRADRDQKSRHCAGHRMLAPVQLRPACAPHNAEW